MDVLTQSMEIAMTICIYANGVLIYPDSVDDIAYPMTHEEHVRDYGIEELEVEHFTDRDLLVDFLCDPDFDIPY
jgi:hypothetical protein